MNRTTSRPRLRDGLDRRSFLHAAGLGLIGSTLTLRADEPSSTPGRRLKVAAVVTEMTHRSHAHVILENFLEPYLFNGQRTESGMEIAGLYVDQKPRGDMSPSVAKEYGFPIFPTIAKTLCLGGDRLAVDAVLAIGEHGRYPVNAKGQREYPRKRFFDEIVAVFEHSGKVVPVFNDKHLSYRWDWAREMVDTARRLKIPFMAGSSVPLAERRPPMEVPEGSEIVSAVSIHGGPLEAYDFHALEVLQSILESRRGGETGVSSVQFLEGEALWNAAGEGLWGPKLAREAMRQEDTKVPMTFEELVKTPPYNSQPLHGILVGYKDGTRGTVLRVGSSSTRWNFAGLVLGQLEPVSTAYHVGPWDNRNLFKALSHAIQDHFRNGRPPYPIERTLLTTGILDAAMDSRVAGGKLVATPHLEFAYTPTDFRAMREMGATWKIMTPDTPQPRGIDTFGKNYSKM